MKRLFQHFAEMHRRPWLKELDQSRISLGRDKRVLVKGGKPDPKYLITVPVVAVVLADAP